MNRIVSSRAGLAVAAGCMVLVAGQAQGAVVLADNFSGSGDLNGRTPTTAQNAGDVWQDTGAGFGTFSAGVLTTSGSANTAILPFVPTAGNTYVLSADMNSTSGNGNWISLGFQTGTADGAPWGSSNSLYGWVYLTGTGSANAYAGLYATNRIGSAKAVTVAQHNIAITLDTTNAQWVVSASVDGSSFGTPYTFAAGSNPAIQRVVLARSDASSGTFQNLQLTAADSVPEPASLAVIGLTGLFGLRRRRS